MNKKVFISMLVLSIVFLVGMYVLKIFFPQEFVLAIENERIIAIGTFIDSHEWLYYVCCGITSFITYWFYCCAVSHRLYLKGYEILLIIATIVIIRLTGLYVDANLRTIISWISFAFLPALCKGEMKTCGFVFSIHAISQGLSIGIRNLPIYFTNNLNFVTTMLVGFESYLWLLLMYIIFNYKKKEK